MSSYDGFAPIYEPWSADMTEDVGFYVALASEADVATRLEERWRDEPTRHRVGYTPADDRIDITVEGGQSIEFLSVAGKPA